MRSPLPLGSLNDRLARRWYEQGKHLGPEGKPYQRLTGVRKGSGQLMKWSNGGVARGEGQPMIEKVVTFVLADAFADAT